MNGWKYRWLLTRGFLAIWHAIFALMGLGYSMEYYFHLRELDYGQKH